MPRRNKIEVPSSFQSPESGLIARANYDVTTCQMIVALKVGADREVEYEFTIPPDMWEEFESASSKGSYFNKVIRPMFAGRKR